MKKKSVKLLEGLDRDWRQLPRLLTDAEVAAMSDQAVAEEAFRAAMDYYGSGVSIPSEKAGK